MNCFWVDCVESGCLGVFKPNEAQGCIPNKLQKGKKLGHWMVLEQDAMKKENVKKSSLVQCIRGKMKRVTMIDLVKGHGRSYGCRCAENSSQG